MKCLKCPKCGGVADIDRDNGWGCLRILCRVCGHDQFIAGPSDPRPFRLIQEERAAALETLPA